MAGPGAAGRETTYSTGARHFHWWTVALLAIQVPVGLYMVYRGSVTNFDALTNTLYSSHKLLGLVILILVLARLFYRFSHGARADEATIEWWRSEPHTATHWSLYLLLILGPSSAAGISLYGARDVSALFSIPPWRVRTRRQPGRAPPHKYWPIRPSR